MIELIQYWSVRTSSSEILKLNGFRVLHLSALRPMVDESTHCLVERILEFGVFVVFHSFGHPNRFFARLLRVTLTVQAQLASF